MSDIILKLDNLNTGTIRVRDRDDVLRFTITIDNEIGSGLAVNVSAWDRDNFGTPNEKRHTVAYSYNAREDRNGS